MIFGCLAASLSVQMIEVCSLNDITAGVIYLPSGIGGVIAAGKLMDWEYTVIARQHQLPKSETDNNITEFPIEKARLRSDFGFIMLNRISTAGYGWTVNAKTHVAGPILMQFLTGRMPVAIYVVCGGFLTDLNPHRSATVQASYNLIRCALGAVGITVLQKMMDVTDIGWCFTIYAAIGAVCTPPLLLSRRSRSRWRKACKATSAPSTSELEGPL